MTHRDRFLVILLVAILASPSLVGAQTHSRSWIDDLRDGKSALEGTYQSSLPPTQDLQFRRSSAGRTDYRQHWEGVPVYGSSVTEIDDDLGYRVAIWTYPGDQSQELSRDWFEPTVSRGSAIDIAQRETDSTATLEAELMILPLPRAAKLAWVIREEVEEGKTSPWEFIIDAKNRLAFVLLTNESTPLPIPEATALGSEGGLDQLFAPSTYALPCPPLSPIRYAYGEGFAHRQCFPADVIDNTTIRRSWKLDSMSQSGTRIRAYEYPPIEPPTRAPLASPADEWIPLTPPAPSGPVVVGNDFGNDHRSAVDSFALLHAINDFWASSSPSGSVLYPRSASGIRVMASSPAGLPLLGGGNLNGSAFYEQENDIFVTPASSIGSFSIPLAASLDTLAHEYGHAMIASAAGQPIRRGESFGLNEGFSDLLALFVESRLKQTAIDWLLGNGLGGSGTSIRNLANPRDPKALTLGDDYYLERTVGGSGAQHKNSTILGLAFSLLVQGGRSPASSGHNHAGPTVSPQDSQKVLQLAYQLATEKLKPTSTFKSIREAAIALAEQSSDPALADALRDAFRAVGVVSPIKIDSQVLAASSLHPIDILADHRVYLEIEGQEIDWSEPRLLELTFNGSESADFTVGAAPGELPWRDEGAAVFAPSLGTGHAVIGIRPQGADGLRSQYIEITALSDVEDLVVTPEWIPFRQISADGVQDVPPGAAGTSTYIQLPIPNTPNRRFSAPPLVIRTRGGGGEGDTVLRLWKGQPMDSRQALPADDGPGLDHELVIEDPEPGDYWIGIEALTDHDDFALSVTWGLPQPPVAERTDCTATTCEEYVIGDTVSLSVTTDPPLAEQPIWTWRWKNGQVERVAMKMLALDGAGQLVEARTDEQGVFTSGQVKLEDPSLCGIYSNEEFAVGSPYFLRSARRSFRISCIEKSGPGAAVAKRPDPHFPHYQLGDHATLEIVTDPPLANAPIYAWRTRDGVPERSGEPLTLLNPWGGGYQAHTNAQGTLTYSYPLDDAGTCGSYTEERFAVGSPASPASGALAFTVYCPPTGPPAVSRPDPHFPSYQVGNFAALRITTDPPQPHQRIFGWRFKDGAVERSGEPMMQSDGAGGLVPWRTDAAGVFESVDVQLNGSDVCGSYSLEQFSVGDIGGPRSAPLSFTVQCPIPPGPPHVTRPDGGFPTYHLFDRASLRVITSPPQPYQPVFGWRTKDGVVERSGEPVYYDDNGVSLPMVTDGNGQFFLQDVLLEDPTVCGQYTAEQFSVGSPTGPRSEPMSFSVSCDGFLATGFGGEQ